MSVSFQLFYTYQGKYVHTRIYMFEKYRSFPSLESSLTFFHGPKTVNTNLPLSSPLHGMHASNWLILKFNVAGWFAVGWYA